MTTLITKFKQALTGAINRDINLKVAETVSVKDFGAVGDGIADDTVAISNAITTGSKVLFPKGVYRITSQLTVGPTCCELYGEGMYTTILSKEFNGSLLEVGSNGTSLHNFGINGNGATYSGAGVLPKGYNFSATMLRIVDTADSCFVFSPSIGTNVGTGAYATIRDCFLLPTNPTTYSIRSTGTDDSNRPTDRRFTRLSGGGPGPDFSGMNLARFDNSLVTSMKFSASSQKIFIGGGTRLTQAAGGLTVYGLDHVIDGNFFTFSGTNTVTIDSTCTNVFFGPNNNIANASFSVACIQNQALGLANANTVWMKRTTSAVFAWKASTTNPTQGNGTQSYDYSQEGRVCNLRMEILVGSTTNVGLGDYSFSLPFKALADSTGPVLIKSSAGVYYPAIVQLFSSLNVAAIYISSAVVNGLFTNSSIALSTGALIQFHLSYQIAPT